jgi:hypothetical protein
VLDDTGAIVGVTARAVDEKGRSTGPELVYRAPLVVAADGNSSRLSLSMQRPKRDDRPMGVAVRTYYTSPRHDDDYLESWLELWSTDDNGNKILLPGYGWIFGVGDGTSNVGLGILNTSSAFGKTDYKDVMRPCRRSGPTTTRPWSAPSAAPPCRWASTASRTMTAACSSWATPAAWSTRSTARASPTPWSRGASLPR